MDAMKNLIGWRNFKHSIAIQKRRLLLVYKNRILKSEQIPYLTRGLILLFSILKWSLCLHWSAGLFGLLTDKLNGVYLKKIKQTMPALIYLPDEIILYIFAYLSHKDLSNLSQTCTRFWNLVKYKPLWETVDLSSTSLSLDGFRKAMRLFQKTSKHFTIRGLATAGSPRWNTETLSRHLLSKLALNCPKIVSIRLLEVYFREKTKFIHFPSTLECLTLHNCQFASSFAFFNSKRIPLNLRHLNIIDCSGIMHRALLVIYKWVNLESLSLENCYNITDNMLFHLASSLKKLSSLDLRGTDTSDLIVIHIGLEMTSLEHLKIGGSPGNHRSNLRNLISDEGILCLDHIAKNFISLDLSNTSITNESLIFIQNVCHSLRQLVVKNTEITSQAVDILKTKLPNCKVIF